MSKKKRILPDEQFSHGPFTYARFGKFIVAKSNMDEKQHAQSQEHLASSYPEVITEIDGLIHAICELVRRLPPDRLLHRAWWQFAMQATDTEDKSSDIELSQAMRMVDYVQSIIASIEPASEYEVDISEEDWATLENNVHELFRKLNIDFQICQTAYEKKNDPLFDIELAEFKFKAQVLWANVRGERYQPHERQALEDILWPHSDILEKLFGVDAHTLVNELSKVLSKLSGGLKNLFEDLETSQEEFYACIAAVAEETGEQDMDALSKMVRGRYPELTQKMNKVMGELLALDLYDLQKITNLPGVLLNELTWSPGEDKEFFAPGDFAGWPLRIWPTMKKPFIRLNGQICCFDIFVLFDKVYRVLQRVIFRLAPEYIPIWNERQKDVSEALPFHYLGKLLPDATVIRPIYYRWNAGKGGSQWHEADGIIIYDDHLIIIEVKAGAFTYTSPATDLPAHLESLKNLILSPANQGSRFLEYLESANQVDIHDANHTRIATLTRSQFRHVTICAVTLDQITEVAARAQHLKQIGVDVGSKPIWALSIDDLRVYADFFLNPLQFLHFVEQRVRAAQAKEVDLDDEMDHLGLYIAQNNYAMYAKEIMGNELDRLHFNGYRSSIDEFYNAIVQGKPVAPPVQKLPSRLIEIIDYLAKTPCDSRSEIACFLLDLSGDFRETLCKYIDSELAFAEEHGRTRPYSSYGEVAFTQFVHSPFAPRNVRKVISHTQIIMVGSKEKHRLALELEYSQDRKLIDINWNHVTLDGLSAADIENMKAKAEEIRLQRIENAKKLGKIGVNQPCPCGSGKKYKRCCRP